MVTTLRGTVLSMTRGAITLARYRGAPIRLHWTLPIVAVLAGGLRFAPGAWLGLVLIVLLHEMGHAFWARRFELDVTEIVVHGLGGHCRYLGTPSAKQRAIVAWGGVLAQAIVLVIGLPIATAFPAATAFQADLYAMLTVTNVGIAVFNLIPIAPLDGAEAWQLVGIVLRERAGRSAPRSNARPWRAPPSRGAESEPRPGQTLGEALSLGVVDERAVRDTVRRALEEAKRDSAPSRGPRSGDDDEPERH